MGKQSTARKARRSTIIDAQGHFGPVMVDNKIQLINVDLHVPDAVADMIESEMVVDEDAPAGTLPHKIFKLRLNREVIDLAEQITNGLIISRSLKDPQGVTMGDMLVLYMAKVKPWKDGTEIVQEVRQHYQTWRMEAATHAMIIALTDLNELRNEAIPYPDDFGQPEATDNLPTWRKRVPHVPQPSRDLNDPYEERFKQVLDFLEAAGDEFSATFYRFVNNNVAKVVREVAAEADNAGFRAKPANKTVRGTSKSAGANTGEATE